MTQRETSQDGYGPGRALVDRSHSGPTKFEFYIGWKEARRLGIVYEPAPLRHCNAYVRRITSKMKHTYTLDEGLIHPGDRGTKYAYPPGLTDDEKRKFRAAARRGS